MTTTNTTDQWLWTDWNGGECPIPDLKGGDYKIALRCKEIITPKSEAHTWGWDHLWSNKDAGDITAYAVLNPNYVAPVPVDYPALLKMVVEALEAMKSSWPDVSHGPAGMPSIADQRVLFSQINATLDAIRKAGVN